MKNDMNRRLNLGKVIMGKLDDLSHYAALLTVGNTKMSQADIAEKCNVTEAAVRERTIELRRRALGTSRWLFDIMHTKDKLQPQRMKDIEMVTSYFYELFDGILTRREIFVWLNFEAVINQKEAERRLPKVTDIKYIDNRSEMKYDIDISVESGEHFLADIDTVKELLIKRHGFTNDEMMVENFNINVSNNDPSIVNVRINNIWYLLDDLLSYNDWEEWLLDKID